MTSRVVWVSAAPMLSMQAWADDVRPRANGSIPAVLLSQDTTAAKPFTCCCGGVTMEGCDQSSPNLIGCEFALAYRRGVHEYNCDQEKQTRGCPAPAGDAAETTQ